MKQFLLLLTLSVITIPVFGQWTSFDSEDRMDGSVTYYSQSFVTRPIERLDFPYEDTYSRIIVGCDEYRSWVDFYFNNSPNLRNTSTENGYDEFSTRVKIDDDLERITLTQQWGSNFLSVKNDNQLIKDIKSGKTLLIELDWVGNGTVYFEYNLIGSSESINETLRNCETNKVQKEEKRKKEIEPNLELWNESINNYFQRHPLEPMILDLEIDNSSNKKIKVDVFCGSSRGFYNEIELRLFGETYEIIRNCTRHKPLIIDGSISDYSNYTSVIFRLDDIETTIKRSDIESISFRLTGRINIGFLRSDLSQDELLKIDPQTYGLSKSERFTVPYKYQLLPNN